MEYNKFSCFFYVVRLLFVISLFFGGNRCFSCYVADSPSKGKPNIVLIYIDDLGYADLGSYGKDFGQSFIETPHIDRLSKQGMKFTNAYAAAPLCSPSRAALLTGKSPARLGFEFVTRNPEENYTWDEKQWRDKFKNRMLVPPPFTLNLPLKEVTLAEMLKGQGYTTAITGKWHVASHYKEYNGWNPDYGPSKQGFDWTADTFGEFKPSSEENITDKGTFPPDELTNKAIEFLRKDHQQPFFLYVSHYLVHAPLGKRIKWLIDKYKHKAKSSESEQKITYAAFVELMDHYVGQLLDAIDEAGLSKNTLVICTSDNGGMPEFAYNRPLRGSKWNLYEGGVRIPMILRWPGKVSEGAICTSPVIQTDFMRTFYEIAGGGSIKKVGIDGLSIVPLLNGNGSFEFEKRILVWHFPYYHPEGMKYGKAPDSIGMEDGYISKTTPQSSIRKGKFKLIYFYETARSELYDLQDDPAEQHDVSSILQQESEEMKKELFSYLSRVKARLPKRNI